MMAVGVVRGQTGVHAFDLPEPRINQPDEVLVRVRQVGLDGTDFNIIRHSLHDIAEGRNEMALGHEMTGVIEAVGADVDNLQPGDAVTMTVRRGCGQCHPCIHNQSDMCMTGLYTERGIHRLDGYLTELVVDRQQYVVKVPPELVGLAIFAEPLSIAEKGIEQIRIIQSRLPWTCPHPNHTFLSDDWGACLTGLVVGAGPLGLLATALLRLNGVTVYTADIRPDSGPKASLVRRLGARYVDARGKSPREVVDLCSLAGTLHLILEASGAADMAVELINYLSRSSIYVMTGIPREEMCLQIDAAEIIRQMVRYNQVIVGSVNSNQRHFEMALRSLARMNADFPGLLGEMINHRFPFRDYHQAFATRGPDHIKSLIEISP